MQTQRETSLARRLRKEANGPEKTAWEALRNLRQQGFPVRRQHPIGPYIVDFAIVKAKLVIEIDGTIHNRDFVKQRDEVREKAIEKEGWKILRIDADTALSEDHIMEIVSERLKL